MDTNKIQVWVVKDEEGNLRPEAYIRENIDDDWDKAIWSNWDNTLSKRKQFQGCTLVKAVLTEN